MKKRDNSTKSTRLGRFPLSVKIFSAIMAVLLVVLLVPAAGLTYLSQVLGMSDIFANDSMAAVEQTDVSDELSSSQAETTNQSTDEDSKDNSTNENTDQKLEESENKDASDNAEKNDENTTSEVDVSSQDSNSAQASIDAQSSSDTTELSFGSNFLDDFAYSETSEDDESSDNEDDDSPHGAGMFSAGQSNSTMPNVWDFAEYGSTSTTLSYQESKVSKANYPTRTSSYGAVTFASPNTAEKNNTVSKSGFVTTYGNMYLNSSGSYRTNGSYIKFVPTEDCAGLSLTLTFPTADANHTNYICLGEKNTDYATLLTKAGTTNVKSSQTLTLKPSGGLKKDTTYYIFSLYVTEKDGSISGLTSNCEKAQMKVTKIAMTYPTVNIKGTFSNVPYSTTLTLTYKSIVSEATSTVKVTKGTDTEYSIKVPVNKELTTFTIAAADAFTSKNFGGETPTGEITKDFDLSEICYAKVKFKVTTSESSGVTVKATYKDKSASVDATTAGTEYTFSGINKSSGFLELNSTSPKGYTCKKYVYVKNFTTVDAGTLTLLNNPSDYEVWFKNTKDIIDSNATIYQKFKGTGGEYWEKVDTIEDDDNTKILINPFSEKIIKVETKRDPYWISLPDKTTAIDKTQTISTNPESWSWYQLHYPDPVVWSEISQNDDTYYKCDISLTLPGSTEGTWGETITDSASELDGTIDRVVTKSSTFQEEGTATLKTRFPKDYYVYAEKDIILAKSGVHEHDGKKFKKWPEATRLPKSGELPESEGGYDFDGWYLDYDYTLSAAVTVSSDYTLCLNGHALTSSSGTVFNVYGTSTEASLNLYDCDLNKNSGHYTHFFDSNYDWLPNSSNGDHIVKGGVITGCKTGGIVMSESRTKTTKINCHNINFVGNKYPGGNGGAVLIKHKAKSTSETGPYAQCDITGGLFLGNSVGTAPSCTSALGGGALCLGQTNASSDLISTLTDVTFQNNANYGNNGGGAIFAGPCTVTIEGCNFTGNHSARKGGAIFFQSTNVIISNTNITNNYVGPYTNTESWGGGIVVNQPSDSVYTHLTLKNKIVISDNYNINEKSTKGRGASVGDNLSIENKNGSKTYPTIALDTSMSPDSVIGINTYVWDNVGPWSGQITKGLLSLGPKNPTTGLPVQYDCFVADNILDPNVYAVVYKEEEVWLWDHVHDLNYQVVNSSTLVHDDSTLQDTLKVQCFTESIFNCNIHAAGLLATLKYNDDGTTPAEIPYDGKGHSVTLTNENRLKDETGSVYQKYDGTTVESSKDAIRYYKWKTDTTFAEGGKWVPNNATESEEDPTELPTVVGKYCAKLKIKGGHYNASSKTRTYTGPYELTSQEFSITPKGLKLSMFANDKPFDGTNVVCKDKDGNPIFTRCEIEGLLGTDTVTADVSKLEAYLDEDDIYVGSYRIQSFDEDSVTLNGEKAGSYYVQEVVGSINIVATQHDATVFNDINLYFEDGIVPTAQLSNVFQRLQIKDDTEIKFREKKTDPDNFTYVPGSDSAGNGMFTSTLFTAASGFTTDTPNFKPSPNRTHFKTYITEISPVDLNGDGNPEFAQYVCDDAVVSAHPERVLNVTTIFGQAGYEWHDWVYYDFYSNDESMGTVSLSNFQTEHCTNEDPQVCEPKDKFRCLEDSSIYLYGKYTNDDEISYRYSISPLPEEGYEFDHWEWKAPTSTEGQWVQLETSKEVTVDFWDIYWRQTCEFKAVFKEINVPNPQLWVSQSTNYTDNDNKPGVGDDIRYTIKVTNTGDVDLTDVKLDDVLCGITSDAPKTKDSLAVGETWTLDLSQEEYNMLTYTLNEQDVLNEKVENVVNVNAKYNGQDIETFHSVETTKTVVSQKKLEIIQATPSISEDAKLGQDLSYSVTVKNNGSVTLNNVTLTHDYQGLTNEGEINLGTINPGQTVTYQTKPANMIHITSSLINSDGEIINHFTADGTYEIGSGGKAITQHVSTPQTIVKTTMANTSVDVPEIEDVVYDAKPHPAIGTNSAYTISGVAEATDVGDYSVTLTLNPWYKWADGSGHESDNSVTLNWSITKKKLTVNEVVKSKTYDATALVSDNFVSNVEGWCTPLPDIPESGETTTNSTSQKNQTNDTTSVTHAFKTATLTTLSTNAGTYNDLDSELRFDYTIADDNPLTKECFEKNYELEFKKIELTIEKFDISTKDSSDNYIVNITTKDLTFNNSDQTTSIRVEDTREGIKYVFPYNTAEGGTKEYAIEGSITEKNYKEGGYQLTITIEGNSNYKGTRSVTWNILKAKMTIDIQGAAAELTYNGNEQSVDGYTLNSWSSSNGVTISEDNILPAKSDCIAKGTNVRTDNYPMEYNDEAMAADRFSYNDSNIEATFTYTNGYLKIKPFEITNSDSFKLSADSLTYNGKTQTTTVTATFLGKTVSQAGNYTITAGSDTGKNASDKYVVSVTGTGNFSGTKSANWAIDKCDLEISIKGITKQYDSTSLNHTFNTNGCESDVLKTTIITNAANQGQYSGVGDATTQHKATTVGADSTLVSNYNISYGDVESSISKAPLKVQPASITNITYDGRVHSFVENDIKFDGLVSGHITSDLVWKQGQVGTVDYGNSRTNAGTTTGLIQSLKVYAADGITEVTDNYEPEFLSAQLTILKQKMTISVVGKVTASGEYVYSGNKVNIAQDQIYAASEQTTGEGATTTHLFDSSKLTPAKADCVLSGTDAGSYKIMYNNKELKQEDFNYDDDNIEATIKFTPGLLTIDKRPLYISANQSQSQNGNPLTADCNITNIVSGQKISGTVTTNSSASGVYDELGTGTGNFSSDITYADGAKSDNYNPQYSVILTIEDKMIITISGHQSGQLGHPVYTYDGTQKSISGYEVSCTDARFDPDQLHLKSEYNNEDNAVGTNAGTYNMGLRKEMFTYDDTTVQYLEIKVIDGQLKIDPKQLVSDMLVKPDPNTFVYNGNSQHPTYHIFNGGVELGENDFTVDYGSTNTIEVGTYKTVITGTKNYYGTISYENNPDLIWTITPAIVAFDVIGHQSEYTYDGKQKTVTGFDIEGSDKTTKDLLKANVISINDITPKSDKVSVSRTNAGTDEYKLQGLFSYSDTKNINPTFNIIKNVKVTINKKTVDSGDIVIKLDPDVYDYSEGVVRTPHVIVTDKGVDIPSSNFIASGDTSATNANNYSINVKSTENSNYSFNKDLGWTINRLKLYVKIIGNSNTVDFNGSEQSVTGFTSALDTTKTSTATLKTEYVIPNQTCLALGTNANKYPMNLDISKFTYRDEDNVQTFFSLDKDGFITIEKIDISLTTNVSRSLGSLSFTYNEDDDGNPIEYAPTIELKNVTTKTILVGNSDYTLSGTLKHSQANEDNKNYTITVTGTGNYKNSFTVTWKINKASLRIKIIGNNKTETYDGTTKTVEGYSSEELSSSKLFKSGKILKKPAEYKLSKVEAGEYVLSLKDDTFSYNDTNINATFEIKQDGKLIINKKDISELSDSVHAQDLVYNATNQTTTVSLTYGSLTLSKGNDFTVVGDSGTNVKTYSATLTGAGNNYKGTLTVDWDITKADITININGKVASGTYDGTKQSVSGYEVKSTSSLFKLANVKYNGSAEALVAEGTDAGDYYSDIASSDFSYDDTVNINPTFVVNQATMHIGQRTVTVSVHASKEVGDTAFVQKFDKSKVLNLVDGESVSGVLTTNDKIVGQYTKVGTIGFTYTVSDLTYGENTKPTNYNIVYSSTLSIVESGSLTITVIGNQVSKVYNGQTQNAVDAGNKGYTVSVPSSLSEENVKLKEGKVAQASQKDVIYTDSAQTEIGCTYMGLTSDDFYYDGSDVVKFVYTDGYIKITPKPIVIGNAKINITTAGTTFIYSGYEQGPSITVKDTEIGVALNSNDYTFANHRATNVGNYNATITGRGNYSGTATACAWSITKASASINITDSKVYDGVALTHKISRDDCSGFVRYEGVTGSVTTLGSAPNIYDNNSGTTKEYSTSITPMTFSDPTILDNYDISYNISLTISRRSLIVTPQSKTYTYSKTAHSLINDEVTFSQPTTEQPDVGLVPGQSASVVTWNNNSQTNAGKYTVKVDSIKVVDSGGADATSYYDITYEDATLTILKAKIAVEIKGATASREYTGSGQSLTGYDAYEIAYGETPVTGFYAKESLKELEKVTISGTDVGDYPLVVTNKFAYNDDNVEVAKFNYIEGNLNIYAKSIADVVISTSSFTYDANEHKTIITVTDGTTTLVEDQDYEIVKESSVLAATKVADYNVVIKGKGNYGASDAENPNTKTAAWKITKASMTIVISGNQVTKPYTGSEVVFPDYDAGEVPYTVKEQDKSESYKPIGLLDEEKVVCSKVYLQKGTTAGSVYNLGINKGHFSYSDPNINATFIVARDGMLTITAKSITDFTATAINLEYNGTERTTTITVTDGTTTLRSGEDYVVKGTNKATVVGYYYAEVEGTGNYSGVIQNIEWQITKAKLVIGIEGYENLNAVYDGDKQTVTGFKPSLKQGNSAVYSSSLVKLTNDSLSTVEATNAGEYSVKLLNTYFYYDNIANIDAKFVDKDGNVAEDGTIATNQLNIKQKELVITAVGTKPFVEEEKFVHDIKNNEATGQVKEQIVGGTVTTNDSIEKIYYSKNHECTISVTIDGTTITNQQDDNNDSNNFDNLFGNILSLPIKLVSSFFAGLNPAYAVNSTNKEYSSNYTISDESTLTITAEEIVTIAGGSKSVDYDGQQHSYSNPDEQTYSVSANFSNFKTEYLTITGDTGIHDKVNAGSYESEKFSASYYDTEKLKSYKVVISKYPSMTINKRSLENTDMSVTPATFEYMGRDIIPADNQISITDTGGVLQTSDYTITKPTSAMNPDTYTITINATPDGNYIKSNSTTYTITNTKRILKVVGAVEGTAENPIVYDGNPHSATGYTLVECDKDGKPVAESDRLIDEDYVTPTVGDLSVSSTNIGTYTLDIQSKSFAYSGDHKDYVQIEWVKTDGKLTIVHPEFTDVTLKDAKSIFEYNATSQGPDVVNVASTTQDTVDPNYYEVTGNRQVDANTGTTKYYIKIHGKGNYAGAADKLIEWTITPASATVTVTGNNLTTAYNGQNQSVSGYTLEVEAGKESIVKTDKITTTSPCNVTAKEVGKHMMGLVSAEGVGTFSYGDSDNVNVTFVYNDGYLDITKKNLKDVSLSAEPLSFVYNADNQYPTYKLTNNGIDLVESTATEIHDFSKKLLKKDGENWIDVTESKNVGTYKYIFTGQGANFEGTKEVEWLITPAQITVEVKGQTATKPYNAIEQKFGFVVSATSIQETSTTGLLNIAKVTCAEPEENMAKGTNVGVYKSSLDPGFFSNSDDATYNTVTTFVVNPQQTLQITGRDISKLPDDDFTISKPIYSKNYVTPTVSIHDSKIIEGGKDLIQYSDDMTEEEKKTADYKVLVEPKVSPSGTEVGYTLTIVGMNNYFNQIDKKWDIGAAEVKVIIKGNQDTVTYNGTEQYATGYTYQVKKVRSTDDDYVVDLFEPSKVNISSGAVVAAGTNVGTYNYGLDAAKFAYTDTNLSVSFEIAKNEDGSIIDTQLTIQKFDIASGVSVGNIDAIEYDGNSHLPTLDKIPVTIITVDGKTVRLTSGINIVGTPQTEANDGDNYYLDLVGDGTNLVGTIPDIPWNIVPRTVIVKHQTVATGSSGAIITESFTKDEVINIVSGQSITGKLTTSGGTEGIYELITGQTHTDTLVPSDITYFDGADAKNYNITYDSYISIGKTPISTCAYDGISLIYNGKNQTPTVDQIKISAGGKPLVKEHDYTIDYIAPHKNAGTGYEFTVTGIGTYTGKLTVKWSITQCSIDVKPIRESEYDGIKGKTWTIGNTDTRTDFVCTDSLAITDEITAELKQISASLFIASDTVDAHDSYTFTDSTYKINYSDLYASGTVNTNNYKFVKSAEAKLTITKKKVVVHPYGVEYPTTYAGYQTSYNGQRAVYNFDSLQNVYNDIEGVAAGEGISGSLTTGTSDDSGKDAGLYSYKTGETSQSMTVSNLDYKHGAKAENYIVEYDAKIVITPATLSVNVDKTKIYDGTVFEYPLQPSDITGVAPGDVITGTLKSGTAGDAMNTGTYVLKSDEDNPTIQSSGLKVTKGTSDNYKLSEIDVVYNTKLSIKPYDMENSDSKEGSSKKGIWVKYKDSFVYSGSEINPTTITTPPDDFIVYDNRIMIDGQPKQLTKDKDYTLSCDSQINANATGTTYKFTITGKQDTGAGKNYSTNNTLEYTWTITPLAVTLKPTGSTSKTYNGDALTYTVNKSDVTRTDGSGSVPEVFSGTLVTNGKDWKETNYSIDNTFKEVSANLAVSGQGLLSNYTITYTGTLSILKKEVIVNVEYSSPYTGQAVSTNYNKANIINAGTSNEPGLVNDENLTGKLTTDGFSVGTYTKKSTTNEGGVVEAPGPTPATGTNKENYDIKYNVTIDIVGKGLSSIDVNYTDSFQYSGQGDSNKKRPDITSPETFSVYDGSTKLTASSTEKHTDGDYYVSGDYQTDVNTGESKYTFTIHGVNAYANADGSETTITKEWYITPAPVTVYSRTGKTSQEYNGSAFTYSLQPQDFEGVKTGDVLKGTLTTGNNGDAKDVANYKYGSTEKGIKAELDIASADNTSNKSSLANYNILYSDSIGLSITKKTATIKGSVESPSRNKTYDGNLFSNVELNSQPASGSSDFDGVIGSEKFTLTASTTSANAGYYSVGDGNLKCTDIIGDSSTGAYANNYNFVNNAVLEISKKTITNISSEFEISYKDKLEYNGGKQRPGVSIVDKQIGDGVDLTSNDFDIQGDYQTDVPTSDYTIKLVNNDKSTNYTIPEKGIDLPWTIAKRVITILSSSHQADYNDSKLYTYNYSSLNGDIVNANIFNESKQTTEKITGSFTTTKGNVGDYTYKDGSATQTLTHSGPTFDEVNTGAKASNYEIKYDATLTIVGLDIDNPGIKVTCDNLVYNGKEQTPTPDQIVVTYLGKELELYNPVTGEGDYEILPLESGTDVDEGSHQILIKGHNNFAKTPDKVNSNGSWAMNQLNVLVDINSVSKTYDQNNIEFQFNSNQMFGYEGQIKGNPLSEIVGKDQCSLIGKLASSADGISANGVNAGTYTTDNASGNFRIAITQKPELSEGAPETTKVSNFYFTYNAELKILPAEITVTPKSNQSKLFNTEDPEFDYGYEGALPGETPGFLGKLNREPGENIGLYDITNTLNPGKLVLADNVQGNFLASNYDMKFVDGVQFEIKKGELTVEGSDYSGVYDGVAHGEAAIPSITAGTIIKYSVNGGEYTTTVPQIVNVGLMNVDVLATNPNCNDAKTSYTLEVTPKSVSDAEVELGDLLIYDPDKPVLQEQKVATVVVDGITLVEGRDYDIEGNKQTQPGKYELTINGKGNYCDQKIHAYVIVGTSDEDIDKIGDIATDIKYDLSSPVTYFDSSKAEVVKSSSDANELSKVASGDKLRIWIEITDVSATIAKERPQSKQALDDKASSQGKDVVSYNDISMFKKLQSQAESTRITNTANPIALHLDIPEIFKPGSDIKTRDFALLRNHSDTVDDVTIDYDSTTFELKFTSDKFSDYALTKIDTLVPKPDPEPEPEPYVDETTSTGLTSDTSLLAVLGVLSALVASACCFLVLFRSKKSQIDKG